MDTSTDDIYSAHVEGTIVNIGGTTTLIESAVTNKATQFTPTVAIAADDTNDALSITVTGASTNTCRYWLHLHTAEVG